MFSPQSQMEYDRQVWVMQETHRKLLGLRDGVEAESRFIAFCRLYAHANEDRYRKLHAFMQLRNLVESEMASPQDPTAASPTLSTSSAPVVMTWNSPSPQALLIKQPRRHIDKHWESCN